MVFWGGAILVGLVAAVFALAADWGDQFFRKIIAYNEYLPLLITPAGFVLTVYLTRKVFSGAEGSGIPQTLIALADPGSNLSNRLLSMRMVVGKVLMAVLALCSGASLGREGPTVHLGAAILHSLGKYAHLPTRYYERGLILTGGGAGIAAAFNTPLAGIIFAIEEMARSYDRRNSGMMMVGVVLAGMTAIVVHQNNYSYYGTTPATLDFTWVWLGVIVCGVIGGLAGGLFSQLLIVASKKLRPYMQNRWLVIALVFGLLVAVLSIVSGGTANGTGYHEAKQIVSCAGVENCQADFGLMYPFYKILATAATYLTTIPGGLFAPSLASGAGLGADLALLFPPEMASTIVILGMIGYFTGVVQTPITAFVIVMEMTDNHELVLAMMATALIASGISKLICKKSIYEALAENLLAMMSDEKSQRHAH
ncbi:Chloride channel protein [hydrothermal vent metagenome]|uniref:Chloride channel protein n=1 Tax=hydrothermal vent metagenome TaxID=652676 RepID=A0A3B0WFU7_9ZZZZ